MNWPILQTTRMLRFTKGGRLPPWLGPVLRGLIARPFKNEVCRHPPEERERDWTYCKGCPLIEGCPYGETFEPDPPRKDPFFKGQTDVPRPIVLSPLFPTPRLVVPEMLLPLQLTFIGTKAIQHADTVWDNINSTGHNGPGLGGDKVLFEVVSPRAGEEKRPGDVELPFSMATKTKDFPFVRVQLQSPLCLYTEKKPRSGPVLQTRGGNKPRYLNAQPTFADLFRAAQRVLGGLYALEFGCRMEADFEVMKEEALQVATQDLEYHNFEQERSSKRSGQRLARGIVGSGMYGPVPAALVPWMEWAGKVHVGTDRVAGAGSWQLQVPST